MLTPVGPLSIQSVDQVALEKISIAEENRAGYLSEVVLLDELRAPTEGEIYRIELGPLRPDPRIALRMTEEVTEAEVQALRIRLNRLDSRAPNGAWTCPALAVLNTHSGVRATDIFKLLGQDGEKSFQD